MTKVQARDRKINQVLALADLALRMDLAREARHAAKLLICRYEWHAISVASCELALEFGCNARVLSITVPVIEVSMILHLELLRFIRVNGLVNEVSVVQVVLAVSLFSINDLDQVGVVVLLTAQSEGIEDVA